jgi:hypothetical protein
LGKYIIPASHSVKNLNSIIANGIIKNFNRIASSVKTNKAIFVIAAFQQTVMDFGFVGTNDVFPCFSMFERRRYENNFRLHKISVTLKERERNGHFLVYNAEFAQACRTSYNRAALVEAKSKEWFFRNVNTLTSDFDRRAHGL